MPQTTAFYLAAIPAAALLGLSKGGFAGLGALALPIMALAISPVTAAAMMLPLLIVSDWVSVWAFRRLPAYGWFGASPPTVFTPSFSF